MHPATKAGENQARGPYSGADRRGRDTSKKEKFEYTFRAIENVAPIRKPNNEISPNHGFQGVPRRDPE